MRLTFVLESFWRGGKERRCLQLIQGLNRNGITNIQVIIINDNRIEYEELYDTSARIDFIMRHEKKLSFIKTLSLLKRNISSFKPDIIVSWGVLSGSMLALLKPFIKVKYISAFVADTIRKQSFSRVWCLRNLIIRTNEKVVGNSQIGLEAYLVPPKKRIRIVNGFNYNRLKIEEFDKVGLRMELGVNTKYMIVMLARFCAIHKDYQTFLEVARKMLKQRDDLSFIGIGSGEEERQHYEMQLSNTERQHIHFIGYRKDIEKILSVSDVSMLFSNLNSGEGISNTIVESMAFGVPVIATWSGGTPEIIENGVNGFMVKDNDIRTIIQYANRLLDDKQLYETISRNSKDTIKKDFTLERMTEKYIELFRSVKDL